MQLSATEQAMLDGAEGPAVQRALAYQVKVGRFFGAARMVPITNAHMMGDIEVLGDAGLAFLQDMQRAGALARIPITTNARCIDFAWADRLGQDPSECAKEREVIAALQGMAVMTTDTCINYQTLYQPHLGERVAWGDTGTCIYANSIFGARTNFESGPAALAAAITGRTPEYGFHLDEHRRGSFIVDIAGATLADLADWGALGKIVGEGHQSYYTVPVFTGFRRTPLADELKQLGAALASYGSMGMFHFVGLTPEAPTLEAAFGGSVPRDVERLVVDDAAIELVYAGYDLGEGDARLVVFSGPQLSLFELRDLGRLFEGRRVAPGTAVFVTSSNGVLSAARKLGYLAPLEAAGVCVLEGVCFYILQNLSQMREREGWKNMISNSAKIVNIIGAHRFRTILRRTADCVEIACTGRLA
ncbi:aconitase X [Roseicella aerolata]|uniref:Aconitase X catalytic domain-containing protein n=1 Tax=Roseicella aerolata TaxID=2883479 RepID=A0A9X1IKN3_9PROT|nr:aconitase X catalytic domain-containing protein [Roseicella aerolata]MCB4825378.1 aconitase X catalytic domain-containing protein [Roseicella aerolata]